MIVLYGAGSVAATPRDVGCGADRARPAPTASEVWRLHFLLQRRHAAERPAVSRRVGDSVGRQPQNSAAAQRRTRVVVDRQAVDDRKLVQIPLLHTERGFLQWCTRGDGASGHLSAVFRSSGRYGGQRDRPADRRRAQIGVLSSRVPQQCQVGFRISNIHAFHWLQSDKETAPSLHKNSMVTTIP